MLNRRFMVPATAALVALTFVACQDGGLAPEEVDAPLSARRTAVSNEPIFADFSEIDEGMAAMGLDAQLATVEYVTLSGVGEYGRIVITSARGNKQLSSDWVSGDPRRGGGTNITYTVDQSDGAANGGGLPNAQTEAAIDRAMGTWDAVECSSMPIDIPIDKLADPGFVDLGVVQFLLGFGGFPAIIADVTHGGWLPKAFFNSPPFFPPNGGDFILGVTFTAIFTSDINNDGKVDTAFREIYYNDNPAFGWGIDVGTFPFDVETLALHEAGHGLSQAHFGDIFIDGGFRFIHFAPFAVMNAIIFRQAQTLEGTDNAGHCSIWGNWPNN